MDWKTISNYVLLVGLFVPGLSGMMLGCSIPDGAAPIRLQNQLPGHLMTNASRRSGWIQMELKHGSPSEEHWSEANKDAHSKCREWGYEEAEVTGTHHFEHSGSSTRGYECRGMISPPSEATTASGPEDEAEAVRTTEELLDKMKAVIEQGHSRIQAIATLQPLYTELRNLAEQGDAEARDMLAGMQRRYAELRSRAEQGDAEAQLGLDFMAPIVSGPELQMETWRCFALSDYSKMTALFTLVRVRSGDEDIVAEVSIADVNHLAQFQVAGLNRRWDWGCEDRTGCRYAFSITPDDTGAYYDFSVSDDGRARPSQIFECQLSP